MELANLVEQGGNNYSCTNLSIKMSGSEVYPNIEIHMLYEFHFNTITKNSIVAMTRCYL